MPRPHTLAIAALALLFARAGAAAPADAADALFEAWFEDYLALNPLAATAIGDRRYDDRLTVPDAAWRRDARALHRRYLDEAARIDASALDADRRTSLEAFLYSRRTALEAYDFPGHLLPFNQMDGLPAGFAQMGSGAGIQPFADAADYERFAVRLAAFPRWVDDAVAAMREGAATGVVWPRVVVDAVIPQLAALAADSPEASPFWAPVAAMPTVIAPAERARIEARYRELLAREVLPAYRRLHAFVRDEYLPRSRASVGLAALPGGARWYEWLARAYTTTELPVATLHETGLAEVARVEARLAAVMARTGFRGTPRGFAAALRDDARFRYARPEELLAAYRALQPRVDAAAPRLFSLVPRAVLEILPIEPFRERAAAAAEYHAPSADGARPGRFYVNTGELASRPAYSVETIYLHEAVPGHHFQISLATENTALPRFRRFGDGDALPNAPDVTTAFTEGWGLYAESLGEELGLFTDPYQLAGHLFASAWRGARLVVDTGLHARGWTRQQAVDYLLAHTALGAADVAAEVDRYIAVPGQALAYKAGELRLRALRERAERALGPRFDPRAFHAEVLGGGPLPLAVLEARIGRWIAARQTESGT